ncbi:hypothetical protein B0T26DRAFT_698379 [Lasiosphaeria miniovina]|uniref:Uncharacterized protein n=1 Tax=Lasiosphaeria miniovina TaxID=1954250 RepID=A0AA40E916_9PEZI|nr:uncharacterized protein B0T26DRAFT_698379 [Lasiosphaeria miniovina]KAK0728541.1 hypothetical protein B0T26DRAFT_698379 [Lasiosphaeria miniovina]
MRVTECLRCFGNRCDYCDFIGQVQVNRPCQICKGSGSLITTAKDEFIYEEAC